MRACFQDCFYGGWILKSYKPKPPAIWIQKQKKQPPLSCILHIFQTYHLQYKADRAASEVEGKIGVTTQEDLAFTSIVLCSDPS